MRTHILTDTIPALPRPVKSSTPASVAAGIVNMKLGIFPEIPAPEMEIFCNDRQVWSSPVAGAKRFKVDINGEEA